jgi:hypothetical protein
VSESDALEVALGPVVAALRRLGVPFYVGGSVASTAWGEFRATNDVDVVATMREEQAQPLAEDLGDAYYADVESMVDAVRRRSSFNLIHLPTMLKVDVFVPKDRPYDAEAMRRRVEQPLGTDPGALRVEFASAEDIVLAKLDWFQRGGRVSERQWRDILGVIRVQASALDVPYLRRWAPELGVTDLLALALAEAGVA